MAELLLTIVCADPDVDALVAALRAVTTTPIHLHDEAVQGRDFSDAARPTTPNTEQASSLLSSV